MLEQFIYTTGINLLAGIVSRFLAALNRFGGQSDDIDSKTQETPSRDVTGGAK